MPSRPPRICRCGHRIPGGEQCPCQVKAEAARNARAEANRPNARQRGYSPKWDRERPVYLAAHPTCVRCGAPSSVVDHIAPHRGDMKLFWRRSNWQALCRSCHCRHKQREERAR